MAVGEESLASVQRLSSVILGGKRLTQQIPRRLDLRVAGAGQRIIITRGGSVNSGSGSGEGGDLGGGVLAQECIALRYLVTFARGSVDNKAGLLRRDADEISFGIAVQRCARFRPAGADDERQGDEEGREAIAGHGAGTRGLRP